MVGILLIENVYMQWNDSYQMFCLFMLGALGTIAINNRYNDTKTD